MSTLVLVQNEKKMRGGLAGYRLPGFGALIRSVRLSYGIDMEVLRSPTGKTVYAVYISSAPRIVRTIVRFADTELSRQQADAVTIRIVFMFHQTNGPVVRTIMKALRHLPKDPGWRRLPFVHNKHLIANPVALLSCESGMDKTFRPTPGRPTPRELALRRYANQARGMRMAAGKAFVTPMSPPPTRPPRWYDPPIWTFSTGDADTGGMLMDPFKARFRKLPGSFRPNGEWSYDPTPAGQDKGRFRMGQPTPGTVYVDTVHQGASTSNPVPADGWVPVIP